MKGSDNLAKQTYEVWIDHDRFWLLKNSDKKNDWGLFESEEELEAITGYKPDECIGEFTMADLMRLSCEMPFFNWFALDYRIPEHNKKEVVKNGTKQG